MSRLRAHAEASAALATLDDDTACSACEGSGKALKLARPPCEVCQGSGRITRHERLVGAALAEYNGDPETFPFEKLDAVTRRMIRTRIEQEFSA